MLLRCGARNFYSFKEGVEISFELPSSCPNKISRGNAVSNLLCVKGSNASGKTNLLKLLTFLKTFCHESFSFDPEKDIPIYPFFSSSEPVELYCEFASEEVTYSYEASLTRKNVISEKLTRIVKNPSVLFEREKNKLVYCIKEFAELEGMLLRSNASIVSTARQYGIESVHPTINPVLDFFHGIRGNVDQSGRMNLSNLINSVSLYYVKNEDAFMFTASKMKEFDTGVAGIRLDLYEVPGDDSIAVPIFRHALGGERAELQWHQQSSGTRELYTILPFFHGVLKRGGVLVLDEFDVNLHPHLLPSLVEVFDDDELNPHGAQMIFSTHHDSVLDYMGKYRTILVEKEEGESFAYRLDELPGDGIRNDRPLAPLYKSGKLGGVPKL